MSGLNPLVLLSDREPLSEAMDIATKGLAAWGNDGTLKPLDTDAQFALRCLAIGMSGWVARVRAMEERLRPMTRRELEECAVEIHPAVRR